jgi:hypothetical protein
MISSFAVSLRGSLCALAATLSLAGGCGTNTNAQRDPGSASSTPVDISGKWRSACLGPQDNTFTRLTFDITPAEWRLDYEVFGDDKCTIALGTVQIVGPYEIGGASPVVAGAYEGTFSFAKRTVTPHAQGFADFLKSPRGCARDGFAVGVAADIHADGCAGLGAYPKSSCSADHDVVRRINDELQFGQRPTNNNMCSPESRPKALASFVLKRT